MLQQIENSDRIVAMSKVKAKPQVRRVMGSLTPAQFAEFEKWRKRLGQDISGFAALCIDAGVRVIARSMYPEEFLSDDVIQKFVDAANREALKPAKKVSRGRK